MPQGRRKTPFSGKAKKLQMQVKKQRQRISFDDDEDECSSNASNTEYGRQVQKINKQPKRDNKSSGNRYTLQFFQETNEELRKRKEQALKSIEPVSLKDQEISDNYFPPGIDMPKRPPWDFNMTKEQLNIREQRYFTVCNCKSVLNKITSYVELTFS